MSTQQTILEYLDHQDEKLSYLARAIWERPEIALEERFACTLLADDLEAAGFSVERGVGQMPTAFVASWGSGTPIIVRAWYEPGAVALSVEDRGCGIPAEDLPRVFEPFYRAESTRRLGHAGVGLGLAVARRIAATHGGTITAESEPGRGSRFVVRLPRAPAPDVAPAVVDRPEAVAPTPA